MDRLQAGPAPGSELPNRLRPGRAAAHFGIPCTLRVVRSTLPARRGTRAAPLLLDDEEAVAVAIGLRTATGWAMVWRSRWPTTSGSGTRPTSPTTSPDPSSPRTGHD